MDDNQTIKGAAFPEGTLNAKKLTYNSYLKIAELTGLQSPMAEPVAHDEMLFIVIHQVYELWFKLVIFELDALTGHLANDRMLACFRGLNRICEIFRVLIQQIDILETMTPTDFNRFRSHLNPASGFQSLQFRAFEIASGADPGDYLKFSALEPEWKNKLEERAAKPNLRKAFFELLKRQGVASGLEHDTLVTAISQIYASPKLEALTNLCESLIRYDEQVSLWRYRHVQMVERMIGMKPGTGGSLGVAYLKQTITKRFFPELWEARTLIGGDLPY